MKLHIIKCFSKIYHFTFSQSMKALIALQSVLFDLSLGKTKPIYCIVNCQKRILKQIFQNTVYPYLPF